MYNEKQIGLVELNVWYVIMKYLNQDRKHYVCSVRLN